MTVAIARSDTDVSNNGRMSGAGWEPIEVRLERDGEQAAGEADLGIVELDAHQLPPGAVDLEPDPELADDGIAIVGPGPDTSTGIGRPRLVRHTLTLDDGHRVSVAVCGRGVPLVVVHGFTAEGILYAQTLSRLVSMGFKVVAIDVAGHGGTQGLPTGGGSLASYTKLLRTTLDVLGVRHAVLAGHSMGGRLVTQLAAEDPERAVAVILLDAIVGDTWDRMVNAFRLFPPALVGVAGLLVLDTLSTLPLFRDPAQAAKLGRLVTPTLVGHARRPWRLLGPAVSILRSRGSRWMLQKLAQERIPVFVVHGDRDIVVPVKTGAAAARRSRGELVVVHGATHSWLLKDPEALPAIMLQLMKGRLGTAVLKGQLSHGVDPSGRSIEEIERSFMDEDALVHALTPAQHLGDDSVGHRPPRYRWSAVSLED